jgi:segregation and condensation protein A
MELRFNLKNFEGPLDLLLSMVKDKKMDLLNVDLLELVEQYIQVINLADKTNLDIDLMGDYLVMASHLLSLKSKLLIQVHEPEIEQKDLDLERDILVNRLIEYKKYKDLIENLRKYELKRSKLFLRPSLLDKIEVVIIPEAGLPNLMEPQRLKTAIERMFDRLRERRPQIVQKINVKELSVEEIEKHIISICIDYNPNEEITLYEYLDFVSDDQLSLQYISLCFVALLNLARRQKLKLIQEKHDSDIIIIKNNLIEEEFSGT